VVDGKGNPYLRRNISLREVGSVASLREAGILGARKSWAFCRTHTLLMAESDLGRVIMVRRLAR
jgi:hypothetical protein